MRDGAGDAAEVLARADRVRGALRSFRLDIEACWEVAGATTTDRIQITFERSGGVRLIEPNASRAARFTRTEFFERTGSGERGGGRDSTTTPGSLLAGWKLLICPTLGRILDGKPFGPPAGADAIRRLPSTTDVETVAWRDPVEMSEVVLTLSRADGLPREERRTFFGADGRPIAVSTERYNLAVSGGGVNVAIPRGEIESEFPPVPPWPPEVLRRPVPSKVALAPEIRRVLEASEAAYAALRSLRGVRFDNEVGGYALEGFAFEQPGKFWRRSRISPSKEIFRTDGKRILYPGETPTENLQRKGEEDWRSFLAGPKLLHRPSKSERDQVSLVWRSPGRFLPAETIAGMRCDVIELDDTIVFERSVFPIRVVVAIGREDRLLRRSVSSSPDGVGRPQIVAFPELIRNPQIPPRLFAVPALRSKR